MAYKLNDEQETLKGGITYYTYIWRTEPGACEACQALDGTEYTSTDEIPDKVHPNCKCYIDVINNQNDYQNNNLENDKNNKDDEPCDCWEARDMLEELIGHASSIQDEIRTVISKISNFSFKKGYEDVCQRILDKAEKWDNALGDFARNYSDMVQSNTKYSDKYFHAKANCEAAQRGLTGETVSKAMSILREIEEGSRKVIFESEDLSKQVEDAKEDFKANDYGRQQGRDNPYNDCGDLVNKYRPNGLDDRY